MVLVMVLVGRVGRAHIIVTMGVRRGQNGERERRVSEVNSRAGNVGRHGAWAMGVRADGGQWETERWNGRTERGVGV